MLPLIAAWDMLLVPALGLSQPFDTPMVALWSAHLAAAALLVVAVMQRIPLDLAVVAHIALVPLSWWVTRDETGAMALATVWTWDFGLIMTGLVLRPRRAMIVVPVAAALAVVAIVRAHPDWSATIVVGTIGVAIALLIATHLAMRALRSFASGVEAGAAEDEATRRAVGAARTASIEAAAVARTLHDTVINTLAAIARAGGTLDRRAVRDVCARDAAAAEAMLSGRPVDPDGRRQMPASIPGFTVAVVRSGLTDTEIERAAAMVPDHRWRALTAAVGEALLNAAKHAGQADVTLDVFAEERDLVVVVADDGRGFDGAIIPGRGLAESVVARASEAEIGVAIDASPGAGTRIRFRCPLDPAVAARPADTGHEGLERVVHAVLRRSGWLWCTAVVAVSGVMELVDVPGRLTADYGGLALVAALAFAAYLSTGSTRRRAGDVVAVLCVPAASAAFLFGYAGVDFGHGAVSTWKPLVPTVPLVVLLLGERPTRRFFVALGLLGTTVSVTTLVVARAGDAEAGAVVVAGLVPIGAAVAFFAFTRGLLSIGERAAAGEQRAAADRLELATRAAVARVRDRWQAAGLRASLDLLTRLAAGRADPEHRDVRVQCGLEEAFLRQLILLSPATVNIGVWFARALREARARGVGLAIHSGDVDVPDVAAANELGELVLHAVATARAASNLIVTLLGSDDQLRMLIVGPSNLVNERLAAGRTPAGWHTTTSKFGEQGLIELTASRR